MVHFVQKPIDLTLDSDDGDLSVDSDANAVRVLPLARVSVASLYSETCILSDHVWGKVGLVIEAES